MFVSNRVAEISEEIPVACWHHIKGTNNPADCAFRGVFPIELMEHALWWKGPQWLRETEDNWNIKVTCDEHLVPSEECDVQQTVLPVIATDLPLLERISSYNHLVSVAMWILQFVNNAKQRDERDGCPVLSLAKLKHAKELWWCITQRSALPSKIQGVENRKGLSPKRESYPFTLFCIS